MPFGSDYTENRAMYEIIRLWIQLKTMKGLIFGGQRAFVVARFTRTCLLFVYCEETNEPDEPLYHDCLMKCTSGPAFYR